MEDLLLLKGIIISTLAALEKDTRPEIKLSIANLFYKPLVNFDEAYDIFSADIGQSAVGSDRWRVIQMDVITQAGEAWESLLKRFQSVYMSVMKTSPGGETFHISHSDSGGVSYNIALMFRVYGDTLYLEEPEPAQAGRK